MIRLQARRPGQGVASPRYNRRVARYVLTALSCLLLMSLLGPVAALGQDLPEDYTGPSPAAAKEALAYTPQLGTLDETSAELSRILAQPDYQEEGDDLQQEGWIEKTLAWLQKMSGGRSSTSGGPQWTWIVTVVIAALLAIYLVTRVIWWLMGRRRNRIGSVAEGEDDERRLSPDGLIKRAEDAARRGEHRSAVRFRYLALLKRLEMPDSPLRTNSQVLRWVGKRFPVASNGLSQVVICYEDTWYGGRACTAADYTLATEQASGVEQLVSAERERLAALKRAKEGQADDRER